MSPKANLTPRNLIDAITASLRNSMGSPEGTVPPAALLWTDPERQWLRLIPALRSSVPELYILGEYDPAKHSGPVIWLRCVVDRTLPDDSPPPDAVPILYLPGVARQTLRTADDCPKELEPLIELQFRGSLWHQSNGRDWTVLAFLTSDQGLGLDVAQDGTTRDAMLRSLAALASEPLETLRGHRLEAEHFYRLVSGDPIRELLRWMSAPEDFRKQCDADRWHTFREVCAREFDFDPELEPSKAGEALQRGGGKWDEVWRRFCEAPKLYRGVVLMLRGPAPNLFINPERLPATNAKKEEELKSAFQEVPALTHKDACERVLALEEEHKARREWVWGELGESSFVIALAPLARLAEFARTPVGGNSLQSVADAYATHGWQCDRAALDALASPGKSAAQDIVTKVVRALYGPWLDSSARHFQALLVQSPSSVAEFKAEITPQKGVCVLFADGLRFDVAGILNDRLKAEGLRTQLKHRIAPLPSVTATGKPFASPVASSCKGGTTAEDFAPVIESTGKLATAPNLRAEMERLGVEILPADEIRIPAATTGGGWSEIGTIDMRGHDMGARLVGQLEIEVSAIADRVKALLQAGWKAVRIVTDHGWLLLPEGLPKVELPAFLVQTKWARCAAVRGQSTTDVPTFPWYWNPQLRIASPPGIGSFVAGREYAHGGVSPQECVVPDMLVTLGEQALAAKITDVQWRGMRCRVTVETSAAGVRVDLRLKYKEPATTIAAAIKEIPTAGGEASLAVADDKHENASAAVVLLDREGKILDHRPTTVGEVT